MAGKIIETHVGNLICGMLAGLQAAKQIKETDVKRFNYTARGAEAYIDLGGAFYRIVVEPCDGTGR